MNTQPIRECHVPTQLLYDAVAALKNATDQRNGPCLRAERLKTEVLSYCHKDQSRGFTKLPANLVDDVAERIDQMEIDRKTVCWVWLIVELYRCAKAST